MFDQYFISLLRQLMLSSCGIVVQFASACANNNNNNNNNKFVERHSAVASEALAEQASWL